MNDDELERLIALMREVKLLTGKETEGMPADMDPIWADIVKRLDAVAGEYLAEYDN